MEDSFSESEAKFEMGDIERFCRIDIRNMKTDKIFGKVNAAYFEWSSSYIDEG